MLLGVTGPDQWREIGLPWVPSSTVLVCTLLVLDLVPGIHIVGTCSTCTIRSMVCLLVVGTTGIAIVHKCTMIGHGVHMHVLVRNVKIRITVGILVWYYE